MCVLDEAQPQAEPPSVTTVVTVEALQPILLAVSTRVHPSERDILVLPTMSISAISVACPVQALVAQSCSVHAPLSPLR